MTATADLVHTLVMDERAPRGRHAARIVTVVCDAHAYSLTEVCDLMPECGPDNLVRIAEQYGVMVEDVTAEVWGDRPWCWEYRFTGPRENVRRAIAEYWGEDGADDYVPNR